MTHESRRVGIQHRNLAHALGLFLARWDQTGFNQALVLARVGPILTCERPSPLGWPRTPCGDQKAAVTKNDENFITACRRYMHLSPPNDVLARNKPISGTDEGRGDRSGAVYPRSSSSLRRARLSASLASFNSSAKLIGS